jgi:hypothetical protein
MMNPQYISGVLMKYLAFVNFLENSLLQTTVFLSVRWSYEPHALALQRKVETDRYYNLVMEGDLDGVWSSVVVKALRY